MVYGNQSSYPINEIKRILSPLKLEHDEKSINCIQKLIERINPSHPAKNFLKSYNDQEYKAGIVDMFLHKSEKFFSIKELIVLLSNYNLDVKNLNDGKNLACTKFFINNTEKLNEIRKLEIEDQWQIGQILNWRDRKISVNCAKKNYLSTNKVNFNKSVREYYISLSPGTSYKLSKNLLSLSDEEGENYQYNFNFKEEGYEILKLVLNGKEKISTILNLYNNYEKSLLEDFFLFLLENSFVDKSLYPIKDLNSWSKIIGTIKAKRNDQNNKELVKTSLKLFLSKITPINKDLEKSILGKNNKPEKSPIIIKINDWLG